MTTNCKARPTKRRGRRNRTEIERCEQAIIAFAVENAPVSVRALFYNIVSLGLIEKTEPAYANLQARVARMRRDGKLPVTCINDETRDVATLPTWDAPPLDDASEYVRERIAECIFSLANNWLRNRWRPQPRSIYITTEKVGLASRLSHASAFSVPVVATRGFASISQMYAFAQEIERHNRPAVILHVGDHDPAGVLIGTNLREAILEWSPDLDVEVELVAVTAEQVAEFDLPTRPTKHSTHSRDFFGESVEVDALIAHYPGVLEKLVEGAVDRHIDHDAWTAVDKAEEAERDALSEAVTRYLERGE